MVKRLCLGVGLIVLSLILVSCGNDEAFESKMKIELLGDKAIIQEGGSYFYDLKLDYKCPDNYVADYSKVSAYTGRGPCLKKVEKKDAVKQAMEKVQIIPKPCEEPIRLSVSFCKNGEIQKRYDSSGCEIDPVCVVEEDVKSLEWETCPDDITSFDCLYNFKLVCAENGREYASECEACLRSDVASFYYGRCSN